MTAFKTRVVPTTEFVKGRKLPKQKLGVFDVSSLKPDDFVVIDEFMGMSSDKFRVTARIVENPTKSPVLEGVPAQRQVLVKFSGSRKNVVVDATWISGFAHVT